MEKINKIIDNRYKIFGILIILLTVFQYFFVSESKLMSEIFTSIGLQNKLILAFYSSFKFFALLVVSYELCYIITNQKKGIPVVGALMIAFSSVVQWNFLSILIEVLILGQVAIILLNKFMTSEKFVVRLCSLIGITVSIILYIFTYFSSYMISFGYVFLALAIWIIIKNKKNNYIDKKDIILMIVCGVVIIVSCLVYFKLVLNVVRTEEIGKSGAGMSYLFSYLYNFLMPFMNMGNNASLANIISVFPIPMIMAIYYLYTKEKHVSFLLPLSIVAVLETVFCISGFPVIISKITLLQNVSVDIMAVAVGFANLYLMLYMLSNIEEEMVSMKAAIRISIIVMCIIIFIPLPERISSRGYLSLFSGLLCLYSFLFLNNKDNRYVKVLLTFLVIFTLVGGIFANWMV